MINRNKILQNSVNNAVQKYQRLFSTTQPIKTGIVMMNMGGPSVPEETGPFLKRLFNDQDIIELGGGKFQKYLGDFVSWRRTPRIEEQYKSIGGSPIGKWTKHQGEEMVKILDKTSPETAPHKAYTMFRYTHPLTEETLEEMKKDGVKHAIAFSQFPQWSCTTSGSSMNELWRNIKKYNLEDSFKWSLIDRWFNNSGYINSVVNRIEEKLNKFDNKISSKYTIVFSAHSVPMKVVEKGDHYITEVCSSVHNIIQTLNSRRDKNNKLKHVIAWQSKVGFMPWMSPSTSTVIESLAKKGVKNILVVPVAFTSDHIETLFEIGEEYKEEAEEHGVTNFDYTEGLNGSEIFINALADIVKTHLENKQSYTPQYKQKCLKCTKPLCRQIINPIWQ